MSPNKKFYYKFQKPDDLYWGLFCCKVAFYTTVDNKLIYYKTEQYAQCGIDNINEWTCVFYSESGNLAFFVERNSPRTLAYTLLDLQEKKIFRKDFLSETEHTDFMKLFAKQGFSDNEALRVTSNQFQNIQTDRPERGLKYFLGMTSWRP
ncbi:MAG: hypothetical protein V4643_01020 [Bacteroidota bacterium]